MWKPEVRVRHDLRASLTVLSHIASSAYSSCILCRGAYLNQPDTWSETSSGQRSAVLKAEADRIAILAGCFLIGFALGAAYSTEIIRH